MEEKIYFENSKGDRLCGLLNNPSGDKNVPIIILCHGFNSGKSHRTYAALSAALSEKNLSSLRFDFYGQEESAGKFEDLTISEAVDEVLQAIKFVKKLGYKKIGLFGSSFGGLAAVIAASKTEDLFAMSLKCPVSSYFEFTAYTDPSVVAQWKKNGFAFREGKKLNYSFFEDIKNNVGYEAAPGIKIPVQIIHGDADSDVDISQSIRLSRLIPDAVLHIFKGADHRFSNKEDFSRMVAMTVDFFISKE